VFIFLFSVLTSRAEATTAVVNGQVGDNSRGAIVRATVEVINDAASVRSTTETNEEGIYSVPNLPPGTYHIRVSKLGFKTIVHPGIVLNAQDARVIGFTLPVDPIPDTVKVEGGAPLADTESPASTVANQTYVENIHLNGRSFQGAGSTVSRPSQSGSSLVRPAIPSIANSPEPPYGVIIEFSSYLQLPYTLERNATIERPLGRSQALTASVAALQEFCIHISACAPELERTLGGQIFIVTRSGTNQFHGTWFVYLRNDALDAKGWFGSTKAISMRKEGQNDFDGAFSGPIRKHPAIFSSSTTAFVFSGGRKDFPCADRINQRPRKQLAIQINRGGQYRHIRCGYPRVASH